MRLFSANHKFKPMRTYFILLFLLLTKIGFSQDSIPRVAKNCITIIGADILVTGNASINYERCFYSTKNFKYFLRAGYGAWYLIAGDPNNSRGNFIYSSSTIPISFDGLMGLGNHYFELDLGMAFLPDRQWDFFLNDGDADRNPHPDKSNIIPIVNFGYRYQKPQGGIIFRFFVSTGGVGLGLGYAF